MQPFTTWRRAALAFSTLVIVSTLAVAQAGQLDTSFGQSGIVTTAGAGTATAIAIQPDGKIVVCGGVPGSSGFVAAVTRYNSDGTLDTSFGTAGVAVASTVLNVPSSITLQSDGKIVVAGFADQITVIRFSEAGVLDSSFGNGGIVSTGFIFSSGRQSGVAVQTDGRIVVAGGNVMARYSSSGQIDSTFGKNGRVSLAGDAATALAILPNGKILVASAGLATDSGPAGGFVTRYNSNGSLDTSFGISGQLGTVEPANAMAVLSNGEIVTGGSLTSSVTTPATGLAVSRSLAAGVTDAKFGAHGGVVTSIANFPTLVGSSLAVQSSGDIVMLGTGSANSANYVFALVRYTPTGRLDTTFGTNGTVTTSFSGTISVTANGEAIQSDGKIVAVGNYQNGSDAGVKLARYLGQ